MFKSGAIVLHITERHGGLLPGEESAQARAITWMFAALSTVEPVVVQREISLYLESDKPWHEERFPIVEDRILNRLDILSSQLGDREWLDGAFIAADLLMVQVLRRLRRANILDNYPNLKAYVALGESRPAFKRAFEAQMAVFTQKAADE